MSRQFLDKYLTTAMASYLLVLSDSSSGFRTHNLTTIGHEAAMLPLCYGAKADNFTILNVQIKVDNT